MKGNPEVISSLLDILALEAALNMQWRRDWRAIHDMGAKGSARDIKNLGKSAHRYMVLVADRILDLGGDTEYDCGSVVAFKTLTDIYRNGLTLETKLADMTQAGIDLAVEKDDEATAEKLRHIEERHDLLNLPDVSSHASSHRRGPWVWVLEALMGPREVVVHEVQRNGR